LKVYHLDRFFWQPNWRRKSREIRIEMLENLVWQRYWVIEGTYINSSDRHLIEADTVIYLDMPSVKCCLRIIKRHFAPQASPRPDIPEGSSDKLTFFSILKVLFFPFRAKKKLENKLRKFPEKVLRLRSAEEIEKFLTQLESCVNEKTLTTLYDRKKKDLILAS
jgi:adenylate kinase family enzyme